MHTLSLPSKNSHNVEPHAALGRPSSSLQIGMASDLGCVRTHNEDSSLAWHLALAQQGGDPVSMGVLLVADGMGGQVSGADASALACRLAARHVLQQLCLPLLMDDEPYSRIPINDVLETAVRIAHDAILHRFPGAGTTMTMALLLGEGVFMAHVGDSRAYLGVRGRLWPVTRDHSMAARLLEIGEATGEEVAARRNVLYKAVGQGLSAEPDVLYRDLPPGTYVLICCDGLWSKVSDDEMAAIVDAASGPDAACQELVSRARERGGEDNISVILAARGWPLSDPQKGSGAAGGSR
jgi:serine/threonine protein phosphatase PrpC